MKILTLIFLLALIAAALIVVAWFLAEFKARRFDQECIYIESLIKGSEISGEAYDDINRSLNDLECYSQNDERRKRSLWCSFQYKYKSLSPYHVN